MFNITYHILIYCSPSLSSKSLDTKIFCNSFSIEKPDYIRKKEMEYQTKINEYYDSLEEEKIKQSLDKILILNRKK